MKKRLGIVTFKAFSMATIVIPLLILQQGCKWQKSKVNALESDDWMRNGMDRFYFVTVQTSEPLEGSQKTVGSDMLYGVGCFGESKDRAALVDAPVSMCAAQTQKIPLNKRTMLHQFKMASDPRKPGKGECAMLLGDANLARTVQTSPREFAVGASGNIVNSMYKSLGWCALTAGTMAFGFGPLTNMLKNGGGVAARVGVAATTAQTTQTAMQSATVVQKLLKTFAGAKALVFRGGAAAAGGAVTAGGAAFAAKGTVAVVAARVGISLLPCGDVGFKIADVVSDGQRNKNRGVFYKSIAEADRLARRAIAASPESQAFMNAMNQGDIREAAAIYNPQFARVFNETVLGTFENGWGGFGKQKFFDMVRELQGELQNPDVVSLQNQGAQNSQIQGAPVNQPGPASSLPSQGQNLESQPLKAQ